MRSREEIQVVEERAIRLDLLVTREGLQLEVLLDIRDSLLGLDYMLQQINQGIREK